MRTNANVRGMKPEITGTLTLQGGNTVSLQNTDFVAGSLSITHGTSNANEFTVGGAVIGCIKFQLMNDRGQFSNINWYDSKIDLVLTFGANSVTYNDFFVVSHKETGARISVETYDRMKYLDEYQIYEDILQFPTTAANAVSAIATARGLVVSGMAYPSMAIADPSDDTMTEREFISYVAQCMGQFVIVDGTFLKFGWYNTSAAYNAGTSFSHDLRTHDITIGAVKVTANDDTTTTTLGSGTYTVKIENNPFITAANLSAIAQQIYTAVHGITFRPGTASIMSDAAIEAGDCISVYTGTETVTMLVTNITYKPTLRESVTADADPQESDLRLSKTDRIKKLAKDQIRNDLNDPTSDLARAIAGGGGGGSGDKKAGGAANHYGVFEDYDANENKIMTVDKDGVVLGNETDEAPTTVSEFVKSIAKKLKVTGAATSVPILEKVQVVTRTGTTYDAGAVDYIDGGDYEEIRLFLGPVSLNANTRKANASGYILIRPKQLDAATQEIEIKLGIPQNSANLNKSKIDLYGAVSAQTFMISGGGNKSGGGLIPPMLLLGAYGVWLDTSSTPWKICVARINTRTYEPVGTTYYITLSS